MRVVVTGATGFLGGRVVAMLEARGADVRALGRDAGKLERFGTRGQRVDLADLAGLRRAFAGASAVVHAAALSAPWGRFADFERANVEGTRNVLSAATVCGVARLVHISSPAVVFDDSDQVDLSDDAPYPARHSSHYALTKRRAEAAVLESSLPSIVLRPKAIYGPGDAALLPRLIAAARRGRLPQVGDGRNRVELTYVDDAARAVLCALAAPMPAVRVPYTVTGGERVLLWEAIRGLLHGLGLSSRLPVLSLPNALRVARVLELGAHLTGREPRLTRYTAQILARTQTYDTTRSRRDLGYVPQVTLEAGLARTLTAWREGA